MPEITVDLFDWQGYWFEVRTNVTLPIFKWTLTVDGVPFEGDSIRRRKTLGTLTKAELVSSTSSLALTIDNPDKSRQSAVPSIVITHAANTKPVGRGSASEPLVVQPEASASETYVVKFK